VLPSSFLWSRERGKVLRAGGLPSLFVSISPSLCTHRIPVEQEHKPVCEHQRQLNNAMREVVKKEVLKLLKVGVIYPISNSEWVSQIHVVPKKGGMIVMRNEKNELIT
jgi:hypothetical protein